MSRQETHQIWADHLKKYSESGVSRQEYCREHGIKDHQLRYWAGRLKAPQDGAVPNGFVKAVVDHSAASTSQTTFMAARLVLSGGIIEFSPHADPAWIARLTKEVAL